MLTVTNIAAVEEIFTAKAPRPIEEVMLEIYPDATRDRNGRYHAPYDGYECPITGASFRAGEFLPMEEDEERGWNFGGGERKLPEARDLEGDLHRWNGTRAQNAAVWAELIAQSKAHDASRSRHVGKVGDKLTIEVTLEFITGWDGYYGFTFLHGLKDSAGNLFIYKGGNRLRTGTNRYFDKDIEKGQRVRLSGKVKEHGVREGVCQTRIERPKVLEVLDGSSLSRHRA